VAGTLIAGGNNPKLVIGSVNLAELFITIIQAVTFTMGYRNRLSNRRTYRSAIVSTYMQKNADKNLDEIRRVDDNLTKSQEYLSSSR